METGIIPLIATVGGFSVALGMGVKTAFDLGQAWFARRGSDGDFLQLYVNGKDYSVDLKTISNGGSERIREAVEEAERCSQ